MKKYIHISHLTVDYESAKLILTGISRNFMLLTTLVPLLKDHTIPLPDTNMDIT